MGKTMIKYELWLQFFKQPFKYDSESGFIMDSDGNPVAEVRGWGLIQYEDYPEQLQDGLGESIANGLNREAAALLRQQGQEIPTDEEIEKIGDDIYLKIWKDIPHSLWSEGFIEGFKAALAPTT